MSSWNKTINLVSLQNDDIFTTSLNAIQHQLYILDNHQTSHYSTKGSFHELRNLKVKTLTNRNIRTCKIKSLQPHKFTECQVHCSWISPGSSVPPSRVTLSVVPHTFTGICMHARCRVDESTSMIHGEVDMWPKNVHQFLSLKIVTGRSDLANYFKNKKWHTLCSDKYFCFKI